MLRDVGTRQVSLKTSALLGGLSSNHHCTNNPLANPAGADSWCNRLGCDNYEDEARLAKPPVIFAVPARNKKRLPQWRFLRYSCNNLLTFRSPLRSRRNVSC